LREFEQQEVGNIERESEANKGISTEQLDREKRLQRVNTDDENRGKSDRARKLRR